MTPSQIALARLEGLCAEQVRLVTVVATVPPPLPGVLGVHGGVKTSVGCGMPTVPASREISPQLWDSTLTFYVNGNEVTITNPDPTMHLVDYLRDVACLKATKVCDCGPGFCQRITVRF